jgi:ATP-dependent DNA helicase UvrD/PcrA
MHGEASTRWDHGLEGPALEIAGSDRFRIRILAGPGTGKTFALKCRVARLLQTGVPPKRIFVCTFTRTAAKDLQKALSELDVPGVDDVRAQTLHGFCYQLLSRTEVLGLTGRVPRTLLGFEERFLYEELS